MKEFGSVFGFTGSFGLNSTITATNTARFACRFGSARAQRKAMVPAVPSVPGRPGQLHCGYSRRGADGDTADNRKAVCSGEVVCHSHNIFIFRFISSRHFAHTH